MDSSKRSTILNLGSATICALILSLPTTSSSYIMWMVRHICHMANTLFHELGHSVFGWLYGLPMAPGIFTVIGADQAGGASLPLWSRTWTMQIFALLVLGGFCNHLRKVESYYFYPFTILFGFIAVTCLTGYHNEIISYMGHGGSILAGGVLLFRAFGNVNMRSKTERWLNTFFGVLLILENFFFSYELIFDEAERVKYTSHVAFGLSHNDFASIMHSIPSISVVNIAWFTIFLCIFIVSIAAFLANLWNKEAEFLTMPELIVKLDEPIPEKAEDLSNF